MATVELVPVKREVLVDERGDALRASWHAEQRTIVLSQWRNDVCRATFRLSPRDAAQLAGFLVASLGEAASAPRPAPRAKGFVSRLRERVIGPGR